MQIVNGTELVLTKPLGQAKGVVLLFHGCQHSALDWGYASPTCPLCLGMPYLSVVHVASNKVIVFIILECCCSCLFLLHCLPCDTTEACKGVAGCESCRGAANSGSAQ